MTVHLPAQHAGLAGPRVLRNALLTIGALILLVVLAAAAVLYKPTVTPSATTGDHLMTPQMIEFRAAERELR